METWTLNHPTLGRIEFQRGYDAEFAELDDTWPEEAKEYTDVPVDAGIKQRLEALSSNPPVRGRILLNGKVLHRLSTMNKGRYALKDSVEEDKLTTENIGLDRSKPHLKLTTNLFNDVLELEYRKGSEIVLFEPPEGSRGEKRREAMESSTLKRVGFPILAGLGKGGWAIAVILLSPLISRLVQWIASFLPDINISLPEMPELPSIELPTPTLPQIQLPTMSFNFDIDLPEAPGWVLFMAEYSKIWVPVLIGIVIGLLALRNHKKSEETKRAWQEKQRAGSTAAVPAGSTEQATHGETDGDAEEASERKGSGPKPQR